MCVCVCVCVRVCVCLSAYMHACIHKVTRVIMIIAVNV